MRQMGSRIAPLVLDPVRYDPLNPEIWIAKLIGLKQVAALFAIVRGHSLTEASFLAQNTKIMVKRSKKRKFWLGAAVSLFSHQIAITRLENSAFLFVGKTSTQYFGN